MLQDKYTSNSHTSRDSDGIVLFLCTKSLNQSKCKKDVANSLKSGGLSIQVIKQAARWESLSPEARGIKTTTTQAADMPPHSTGSKAEKGPSTQGCPHSLTKPFTVGSFSSSFHVVSHYPHTAPTYTVLEYGSFHFLCHYPYVTGVPRDEKS